MKKFDELAENISEEDYRNNGRIHYSDIAGYLRDGFSHVLKKEKETSPSIMFGSLVDCLVTEGTDKFNEKYCVERKFNISDNQKAVAKRLADMGYSEFEDIDSQTILSLLDEMDLYSKNKPWTRVSKINECKDYFDFIVSSRGKTPVDSDTYNEAVETANILVSSRNTNVFFDDSRNDGLDRYFQLKFNGDYEGIPITCMVDETIVDHERKKVWLVDLKTTMHGYDWEFPKSFVAWNYDIQCRMYSYIVRQVMDRDDFYKDYELCGFTFIYISKTNKSPLIWTFDDPLKRGTIKTKDFELEDFSVPLKELYEIRTNNLMVPQWVSTTTGNDIIEGLDKIYRHANKNQTV